MFPLPSVFLLNDKDFSETISVKAIFDNGWRTINALLSGRVNIRVVCLFRFDAPQVSSVPQGC